MRRLWYTIKNLFKLARLLSVDDTGDLRFATIEGSGKASQKILLFTPYGLMSRPPAGSLALVWAQNAQEANGIGIADDPNNRTLTSLASGEVALGNYTTGHYIYFDANGLCTILADNVNIVAASDINLTAENITLSASSDISITGDTVGIEALTTLDLDATTINQTATTIGISGALTNNGVNIGSTHIHSQGQDSGADTEQDTGVPHS